MNKLLATLSLTVKLALAPGFALLCMCAVAVAVFIGLAQMRAVSRTLDVQSLPSYDMTVKVGDEVDQINGMVNQSLAWSGAEMKPSEIEKLDAQIVASFKRTNALIQQSAADSTLDPEVSGAIKALVPVFRDYEKAVHQTMDMKSAGLALAGLMMTGSEASYAKLKAAVNSMIQRQRAAMGTAIKESDNSANRTWWLLAGTLAVAVILVAGATWGIVRAIGAPIARAETVARAMADGDLSAVVSAQGTDATARMLGALAQVTTNLSGMVGGIRTAADLIENASNEIAQGNQDLSQRTEMQASSLQQTAASVDELSATCKQSAENASEARHLALGATDVANEGKTVVLEVVDTMQSIQSQAKRIAEIIGVIDGIAFQTNILALNAAVEAARAGEQGRGFAVVASEVRSLAGRSAQAAKEIRSLITASVEQVETGTQRVESAGRTMERIVGAIRSVEQRVVEIHAASLQQADGIAQVNLAVNHIDQATQQNAALVEQAAAAAESLRGQARNLVTSMSRFKLRSA